MSQHIGTTCQLYTLNGIENATIDAGNGVAIIRSTQSKTAICVNWQMVNSRMEEAIERGDKQGGLFYAC